MGIDFLAAVFVGLYVPGRFFLRKLIPATTFLYRSILYIAFGMVMWVVQAYIFGYAGVRWATYIYIAIFFIDFCRAFKWVGWKDRSYFLKRLKMYWWVGLLFVLGVAVQTFQSIPSGFVLGGWRTLIADDSLWHLGLTGELVRHVPPFQPGTIGIPLTNYHYLSSLFIADFVRVFYLPILTTQFLYTYTLMSLFLGLLLFTLSRMIGMSVPGAAMVVYLQYFASDIIYLIPLVTRHTLDFSVHPLEDGTMFLENPPRALASVFTVLGIILLYQAVKTKRTWLGIFAGITFGVIIGCKVHSGIMVLLGLAGFSLFIAIKKQWSLFIIPATALLVSAAVYLPTNSGAGGALFSPFEMARMFVVQPNLQVSFIELRRQIYAAHNNVLRVAEMNGFMLLLFYVAQFGVRSIGWLAWKDAKRTAGAAVAVFIFSSLVGTTVFATLYIQPITFADIFNSYLAASVILSLLTGILVERIFRHKNIIVIVIIIASLTLPRISDRVVQFVRRAQHATPLISMDEFRTEDFIRANTESDKVMYVFNRSQVDGYASYVSAINERDTFLAGQNYLSRHAVDFSERQRLATILETSENVAELQQIVEKYNIGIFYAYKSFVLPKGLKALGVKKVFETGATIIYTYESN